MKLALAACLLFMLADAPTRPDAAIPYFTNVRDVQIAQPGSQNYFVVDEELWTHSGPDLGDLRLMDGDTPVQYALSAQSGGTTSEEVEAKILNLGSVSGHTEFDLDAQGLAEYDRIRLRLDAHDFVATASVSGGSEPGKANEVQLTPSTLYDFTKEQLGSNFQLKLPASSFRYLHIKLSPGISAQQVKGANIFNLREQQARWVQVGACGAPRQKQHITIIACSLAPRVPLNRIAFQVAPGQVNFRRSVLLEDDKDATFASGEISRVRVNRGGTLVVNEELSIAASGGASQFTIAIDNGDNPPLKVSGAELLSIERRVYFDPQGKSTLRLYYGDEKLPAPVYDYARFFHQDASAAEARLGPGAHNAQYAGRPDERPWSERHPAVLWSVMLVAVAVLALLAFRGLRTPATR